MIAYKLLHYRKDGTLGPLFINAKQRIPVGEWLKAEAHRKKGYAFRPGWHCTLKPSAPHLKQGKDRVWCKVEIDDVTFHNRPAAQGGCWALANSMKVLEVLN